MLKKGDKVDLIAPSSGFAEEEYKSCLKIIDDLGLEAIARPYSELVKSQSITSNDADYRFEHLEKALTNRDSKAIWCIAGGYGSYHLLDKLDKIPRPHEQKVFIGFSDNSALLNYFVMKWNFSAIYGPTLLQIARSEVSDKAVDSLKAAIFADKYEQVDLKPLNENAKKSGQVAGKMVGGCLSLVQTGLGTPQGLNPQGKVILLEDDKYETPGRLDRIFNHMGRAGFFNSAAAVILGSFLEDDFSDKKKGFYEAVETLKSWLEGKSVPLYKAEDIGHCKNMKTVPFGTFVNITKGENPILKFGL